MPEAVFNHQLAQVYHISPLEVERWSYVQKRRYLSVYGEAAAGQEYRHALESFKNEPSEFEPDTRQPWPGTD